MIAVVIRHCEKAGILGQIHPWCSVTGVTLSVSLALQ